MLNDGAVRPEAPAPIRLSLLVSGLLLMMTDFQAKPSADRARLIARRLVVLSEHDSADPAQRDLARGLAEHWLRVVQSQSVDWSRTLN